MWHAIKAYFIFLWHSKNAHGVHSPFVYNLVTKCFYNNQKQPDYKILSDFRNNHLLNTDYIEVKDFGAGSRVFRSNKRQIRQIAENAGISRSYAQLLYRITGYFKPDKILEIGTSLGLATVSLQKGNPDAQLITLEGCPETARIARQSFVQFNLSAESKITSFEKYFDSISSQDQFDLVYFDGNHSEEATITYFKKLLPTVTNTSCWIFDDIHWSEGMENAWKFIQNHPKVTVTIDTFQWGIVFFRTEQIKENFIIRVHKNGFYDIILGVKNLWGLIH